MKGFDLRPASEGDYELAWTIQRTSIGPYVDETFGAPEEEQRAFFDGYFGHRDFEIVQVSGRDAGFLSFETREAEVYLGHIALLPEFQNVGIGGALVRHVIDHAEEAGLPVRLRVIRSNPARRFYERLGFSCYGETETHFLLERTSGRENELLLRLATPSEREELEALQRRASLANPGDRASLLAHPDAIGLPLEQIESGRVIVTEAGSTVLGFAAVVLREDGDAKLDALFVEPGCWRRGIGRALVEQCVELAGSLGATSLHFLGNPHAEGFYTACGFDVVGTAETRFGAGILMSVPLA